MKYYNRLKLIRKKRFLSQKEVAKILRISQVQYSRYERGVRTILIEKIAILAKYYKVNVDYLLCLTDISTLYPNK